ncbi:hypothetical protein [Mycoplasmopsis synoviae]|uniref:hypothetical protein n=1 Tax=Mycoplasmopsis synoviae TaxID=2109 RepID=UPI00059D3A38|nr:hypothetical protein [Mycoplasmopsis synoviae]
MAKHFDFHGKTEEFVAAKLPNLIQENVLKNNQTIVLISGRGTYAMKTHLENYLNEYEGIFYSWDDRSNSFFVRKKKKKKILIKTMIVKIIFIKIILMKAIILLLKIAHQIKMLKKFSKALNSKNKIPCGVFLKCFLTWNHWVKYFASI